MTKKKKIGLIIGVVVLLFLAGVSLFIAVTPLYKNAMKFDETNTVECSATVTEVISKDKSYEISVSEYSCVLLIKKDEIINEKALLDFNVGENITFNIPKFCEEALSDSRAQLIYIVSLKNDNTNIVTFESHNSIMEESFMKVRITAFVFASLFLCGAIICLVFLIKQSRVKKPLES